MNGDPQQPDQASAWATELDGGIAGIEVAVPAAITAEAPPVTLEDLDLADLVIDADGIDELGELLASAFPSADPLAGAERSPAVEALAQVPGELTNAAFDILFDDGTGPVVSVPII